MPLRLPQFGLSKTPVGHSNTYSTSTLLRRQLIEQLAGCQNNRCVYCKLPISFMKRDCAGIIGKDNVPLDLATIEHVLARSHQGTDEEDNLVAACHKCNQMRSNYADPVLFEKMITLVLQNEDTKAHWHHEMIYSPSPA